MLLSRAILDHLQYELIDLSVWASFQPLQIIFLLHQVHLYKLLHKLHLRRFCPYHLDFLHMKYKLAHQLHHLLISDHK